MGYRPYPNAARTRRHVDARHGSRCPRCGHRASVHPYRRGQFVCDRLRDGVPSCRECAARLLSLRNSPLRRLAETTTQVQITMPVMRPVSPSSDLAVRSVMASLRQAFPNRA